MIRLRPALLALGLAASLAADARGGRDDAEALAVVTRLRGEGRFAEALAASADVRDPAAAEEARLLVAWEAGDLGGALHHGLAGLEAQPEHLTLLWLTTRLSLDLAATELATSLQERLTTAVAAATELDPATRSAWNDEVARLAEPVAELDASRLARETALARARGVVLGALALLAAFWAVLARRG